MINEIKFGLERGRTVKNEKIYRWILHKYITGPPDGPKRQTSTWRQASCEPLVFQGGTDLACKVEHHQAPRSSPPMSQLQPCLIILATSCRKQLACCSLGSLPAALRWQATSVPTLNGDQYQDQKLILLYHFYICKPRP